MIFPSPFLELPRSPGPAKCEEECRSNIQLRFQPDVSTVAFQNFSRDRQSGAGPASKFVLRVEALEDLEYLFIKAWLDANPVVADIEDEFT
jgi:hypothetical protein